MRRKAWAVCMMSCKVLATHVEGGMSSGIVLNQILSSGVPLPPPTPTPSLSHRKSISSRLSVDSGSMSSLGWPLVQSGGLVASFGAIL